MRTFFIYNFFVSPLLCDIFEAKSVRFQQLLFANRRFVLVTLRLLWRSAVFRVKVFSASAGGGAGKNGTFPVTPLPCQGSGRLRRKNGKRVFRGLGPPYTQTKRDDEEDFFGDTAPNNLQWRGAFTGTKIEQRS